MALQSPGVQVTVIDESFYTPAEPGTTPLIVVATAQNKSNAAGTGTAAGTLRANSGRAFRITSQRDLVDTFGIPFFEKSTGDNPVHGGERNEYGLLAAYSLLGVTNSVFILRSDIDLDQLAPQAREPGTDPVDGQIWIDTASTSWGIKEWNAAPVTTFGGQKFANKTPIVLTSDDVARISNNAPLASVGSIGDYAVVIQTPTSEDDPSLEKDYARVFYKSPGIPGLSNIVAAGQWVLIGSNEWSASFPTVISGNAAPSTNIPTGTFRINGTAIIVPNDTTTLDGLVSIINTAVGGDGIYAANIQNRLYLYTKRTTGDGNIEIANDNGDILDSVDGLGIIEKTYFGPALRQSPHTQVPAWKISDDFPRPSGSVWINTTQPNNGARWRVRRWNSLLRVFESVDAPIYQSTNDALAFLDRTGGGSNLPVNTLFVQYNAQEHSGFDTTPATATFRAWRRSGAGATVIKSQVIASLGAGSKNFEIAESLRGQSSLASSISVTFTAANSAADADAMVTAINAAGFENIQASVTANNEIEISHKLGGDFRILDTDGIFDSPRFSPYSISTKSGTRNFYQAPEGSDFDYVASNWQPLAAVDYVAKSSAPQSESANDQLWYNPEVSEVDIMIHNGNTWVGYRDASGFPNSDINGAQVRATAPNKQSDGTTDLVNGDLWISTADLEDFPTIYRWSGDFLEWQLIDKSDQITEDGILFADARAGVDGGAGNTKPTGTISQMLVSNFLDPDAPDPALYPKGMLLWNLRRSGGNVKRYQKNYIDLTSDNLRFGAQPMGGVGNPGDPGFVASYFPHRWVTASANNEDGSGSFLRKAQRKVVVSALKSVIDTSSEARDEERRNFNLIACPGYPEAFSNMINLNIDRGETAFVIADSPFRLPSDATSIIRWASNEEIAFDNGDQGLVSFDAYSAVFYPSGFTTDLSGSNAVVPASHMMLRTMTLSDQVSYPWFAPAGTRRGGITNATAVGFIDSQTGEFQTVALNEGQRDVLYGLKVNPITFFNGVGLVNFGQKTRSRGDSALDRINVARLVVYLRSQLQKLARPYIFEPNDKLTRDEVRQACESLLLELVGLRAIFDFAVVCDESNNTPSRVDRNELWVDIAIEPVKSIEFIYIPLRVKNTGEI